MPSRHRQRLGSAAPLAGFQPSITGRFCPSTEVANIRAEVIPYIGGEAAADAAKFARVVTEVVAKHMGCWDEDTFKKLGEEVTLARVVAFAAVMPGALP